MKVVVLGLDGMDPDLVTEMEQEGRLNNLASLKREGVYSELRSTFLPLSPAAWTSFLTGCNPGKHGIYDFITREGEDGDFTPVDASDRKMPTLADYLNANGLRVGLVGVPLTYPVQELDGFTISGFPTPAAEGSFYPDSLQETTPVNLESLHPEIIFTGENRDRFLQEQRETWEHTTTFFWDMLQRDDWDVYVQVFKQTDDIAHVAWGSEELHETYEQADELVGETIDFLEEQDEDFLLIVMSDHGFGPVDKTLFLNNLLKERGHLTLKQGFGTRMRLLLHRAGINLTNVYTLLSKIGWAEKLLSMSYRETAISKLLKKLRETFLLGVKDIAPDSPAFARGNFGQIFVDDQADIDTVRTDLEQATEDDEPLIASAHEGKNIFHGPEIDKAPDLIVKTPGQRYMTARGFELGSSDILTDHVLQREADHKENGIFFAYGSGVDTDSAPGEIAIEDILPTLLYSLGLPIPEQIDGKIIDMFEEPVEAESSSYNYSQATTEGKEDEEEIKKRLQQLGYGT